MTAAGIVELDELRVLVVVDNEIDMLSSVAAGVPQMSSGAYMAARVPAHELGGYPSKVVLDRMCCAGHGLSLLVTARRGDEEHTVLLDAGPYGWLWADKAVRLGVDLASVEAVFLSHWHSDHSGGLTEAVKAISEARRQAGRPAPIVDLHPDRPDQRGILSESGTLLLLPEEPRFEQLEAAGGRVIRSAEPHPLGGGFLFGSGYIERVTAYETGLLGHHTRRGSVLTPDPLIRDERFIAARVRGRGVTVLTACSHAGVVNACLAATAMFAEPSVDLVLGGFHLSGKGME